MLVLGINGSDHKEGIGSQLLAEALLGAQNAGAEVDFVHLADHITTFPPVDYGKEMPAELKPLSDRIHAADAIVFATPVHWFNMSTRMKALIDFMTPLEYPDFPLVGKVAGFIATCDEDGGQQAISLMAAAMNHCGFLIPPFGMVFHNNKAAGGGEGGWQNTDARLLGRNVVKLANATKRLTW